jgi:hypothetical protein
MDHHLFARIALALLCSLQAILTVVIDLGRSHARNPLWLGHARFHVVWQVAETALLGALGAVLVLWPGPYEEQRFFLTAALAAVPLVGFMAALAGRGAYGGALSDPNGIPPVRFVLWGKLRKADGNVAAVIAAMGALAVILAIFEM